MENKIVFRRLEKNFEKLQFCLSEDKIRALENLQALEWNIYFRIRRMEGNHFFSIFVLRGKKQWITNRRRKKKI